MPPASASALPTLRRSRRLLATGLVGVALLSASSSLRAEPAPPAPVATADVDAMVRAELERTWAPGCALAVVKGGQVVYSGAHGLASVEYQAPMTPSTVFQIGSVTKQITAVLTLMLVDEGKLSLDDPLSKWLEGIPDDWKPATIRQLLSHQSGITPYTASLDFRKSACRDFTPEELLAFASSQPMRFAPGQKYGYSNTNHFLVGRVLEKVTGKGYCDLVAERITTPLGMTATRCSDERAIVPNRASGYTGATREGARRAEPVTVGPWGGSGALESTIGDMVKWDAALQGGKLLRPERVNQLAAASTLADGSATNVGLGWILESAGLHRLLAQSGGHPGFNAAVVRLPDDDMFAVAMVNSDMVSAGHLAKRALSLWVPDIFAASEPSADPDPALTARLRAFLLALPGQSFDRSELSPEAAERLAGEPLKQAGALLGSLGNLQALEILDRRPIEGGLTQVRYKATYEKLPLATTWIFTPDGKIAGLNLEPMVASPGGG